MALNGSRLSVGEPQENIQSPGMFGGGGGGGGGGVLDVIPYETEIKK